MAPSPAAQRLAFVDGMRALSALWVIAFDVWRFQGSPDLWPLTPLFQSGHLGVEVFMVLSGFCLFYPFAHKGALPPGHWRQFFIRRVRRILPPYYVAIAYAIAMPLAAAALLARFRVHAPLPDRPTAWDLASHLTLVHNLFPDVRSTLNASFWSLSLEAQFYLVFPLMAIAVLRARWLGVAAIAGLCLLYRGAVTLGLFGVDPTVSTTAYGAIVGRLTIFGAGMLAAWIVRNGMAGPVSQGMNRLGDTMTLPMLALGYWWYFHPWGPVPLSDMVIGTAIAWALVRYATTPRRVAAWLSAPWLVAIGEISYSFYLINRPTCYYVGVAVRHWLKANDGIQLVASLGLGVLVSLAIARLFYQAFERPFLLARSGQATTPVGLRTTLTSAGT
jgi:peptidoglycan/LPS O-acetylase OafA/YrhL